MFFFCSSEALHRKHSCATHQAESKAAKHVPTGSTAVTRFSLSATFSFFQAPRGIALRTRCTGCSFLQPLRAFLSLETLTIPAFCSFLQTAFAFHNNHSTTDPTSALRKFILPQHSAISQPKLCHAPTRRQSSTHRPPVVNGANIPPPCRHTSRTPHTHSRSLPTLLSSIAPHRSKL